MSGRKKKERMYSMNEKENQETDKARMIGLRKEMKSCKKKNCCGGGGGGNY